MLCDNTVGEGSFVLSLSESFVLSLSCFYEKAGKRIFAKKYFISYFEYNNAIFLSQKI